MHKATHVIIASFFRDNRGIAKTFARPFGVDSEVPTAWGRPKASDVNPSGTGKGNPLDQAERLINLVHPHDPVKAREMAENFIALVDQLDAIEGEEQGHCSSSVHRLLAKSICEHSDIAAEILNGEITFEGLERSMTEIRQAKVALIQLEGAVKELLVNFPLK